MESRKGFNLPDVFFADGKADADDYGVPSRTWICSSRCSASLADRTHQFSKGGGTHRCIVLAIGGETLGGVSARCSWNSC